MLITWQFTYHPAGLGVSEDLRSWSCAPCQLWPDHGLRGHGTESFYSIERSRLPVARNIPVSRWLEGRVRGSLGHGAVRAAGLNAPQRADSAATLESRVSAVRCAFEFVEVQKCPLIYHSLNFMAQMLSCADPGSIQIAVLSVCASAPPSAGKAAMETIVACWSLHMRHCYPHVVCR